MRVAINTLSHVAGGSITYLKNILPHFAGDDNEYVVFVPEGRDVVTEPSADNVEFYHVSFPTDSLPLRMFYEQVVFPFVLLSNDIDLLFSPGDITTLLAPCPVVLAVRNPNPYFDISLETGSKRREIKLSVHRLLTKLSARRARRVFFVSEFSRDIVQPVLGVDDSKARVVYHGLDASVFESPTDPAEEALRTRISEARPYLLSISTINPHKNFETLLRGYATLPEQTRAEYDLVIAGRVSAPEYFDRLQEIVETEGIEDRVHFLGEVPYESVPYLYDNAEVYVLPSELETFGHTLVESMASGVPVVAADSTCIPEITAGAARLFDPTAPSELADCLQTVIEDATLRQSMIDRGRERAEDFSWKQTADQTRELFEEAVASGPPTR